MRRQVKKHLPNAITCANLFSGCVGIVFAFQDNLVIAAYAIFLAAIFDFFDGFASRVLNSTSCIGKDLDSLSDMVSFGVLPSAIVYELLSRSPQIPGIGEYVNYAAFLLAVFSMLRLAKFNSDTRQADSFIGLPTPANAILIASIPLIMQQYDALSRYILNPYAILVFIALMCTLLVAEIPLMSLKFKNSDFNKNFYRYLLLLFSAILILFFKFAAVPVVIVMYITLSLIQLKFADDTILSRNKHA
jgi:CDP-diacylglycerol--serine O-phosphatidyltransferase